MAQPKPSPTPERLIHDDSTPHFHMESDDPNLADTEPADVIEATLSGISVPANSVIAPGIKGRTPKQIRDDMPPTPRRRPDRPPEQNPPSGGGGKLYQFPAPGKGASRSSSKATGKRRSGASASIMPDTDAERIKSLLPDLAGKGRWVVGTEDRAWKFRWMWDVSGGTTKSIRYGSLRFSAWEQMKGQTDVAIRHALADRINRKQRALGIAPRAIA